MGYDSFNRLTARTAITGAPLNESWSYDRYGNRWNQTAAPSGSQAQFAFNPANNQVVGFQYDAAGNLLSDGMHTYSYDAEGNLTLVDGGAAARYAYDAANHRVRTEAGGKAVEWLFNLAGQKVSAWDADTGAVLEQSTYWGAQSLSVFTNNTLYFEHADWLGSKRLLSAPDGSQAGAYGSLPFGDDLAVSGADVDPLHFAGLDHDYESGLDHAQYREYSSGQAHWMSPDPYSGSYDWSNPQSLNRYSYALNNPLSFVDPTGLSCTDSVGTYATGADGGTVIDGNCFPGGGGDGGLISDLVNLGEFLAGLFGGPQFNGSLTPRPATPNSEIFHTAVCSLASPMLKTASATHLTVGAGGGASAGGGLGLGFGIGGGVQAVADSQGNIGVAFSFSGIFPGPIFGVGAIAGGQVSASNARTISDLGGPAIDANASGAIGLVAAGLDLSRAPGGIYSATATVGVGVGTKGAALLSNYTFVPPLLSTNCR